MNLWLQPGEHHTKEKITKPTANKLAKKNFITVSACSMGKYSGA